jgi:Protein of unknown function (DUF2877)
MSIAYSMDVRTVPVVRAGVQARNVCRRGGRGAVAAVFDRSFYLRIGDEFLCIGEPTIGNGPSTLIVAARVAPLGMQAGQPAFLSSQRVTIGDLRFDLARCATWRPPAWPAASSALRATCDVLARRAATGSPPDSLARAIFTSDDTPLARVARPRLAKFEAWIVSALSAAHNSRDQIVAGPRAPSLPPRAKRAAGRVASEASRVGGLSLLARLACTEHKRPPPLTPPRHSLREWGEGNLNACADGLIGLGPGLTPSGDDFLLGALAMLDALQQTNVHAALAPAVLAGLARTSPLSGSFLRAATAGDIGENLHVMISALIGGHADAAIAAAARIGHTSGWDALAGAVVVGRACSPHERSDMRVPDVALRAHPGYGCYRC